jgi:hypothetical protein
MTCLHCGGAGLLLDFDASTYDLCSCAHGALRKAHMSSVTVPHRNRKAIRNKSKKSTEADGMLVVKVSQEQRA